MKYCWSHSDSSGNILAPGVILLGGLCLASIIGAYNGAGNLDRFIRYLAFFLILYTVPLFCAFISARKYQVDEHGITIEYPFWNRKKYSWSDISQVAICKLHYASGSDKHIIGIRCAIGPETCVPLHAASARERWSSAAYEFLHFRKLVTIYFTEERLSEFEKYYPSTIKDYRYLRDSL